MYKLFVSMITFIIVLGLLIFSTSIKYLYSNYLLHSNNLTTTGRVINTIAKYQTRLRMKPLRIDTVTLEFKANNNIIRITEDIDPGTLKLNDETTITYNKDSPFIASVKPEKNYYIYVIPTLLGLIIMTIGILALFRRNLAWKKFNDFLKDHYYIYGPWRSLGK